MRKDRMFAVWTAGGLANGFLAATVWAQPPAIPAPPAGPPPGVVCEPGGPVHRATGHVFRTLQDNLIGYPEYFNEPPPGFYLYQNIGAMRAKADPHKFTMYRSDFLDGTDRLSPGGAGRFNLMAGRVRAWPGPIVIEWSPDQPGLAESRRAAVLTMLQAGGCPVAPGRVVIGPTGYPGLLGTDAANNYATMINRDQSAPQSYTLTPNVSGSFGGGR